MAGRQGVAWLAIGLVLVTSGASAEVLRHSGKVVKMDRGRGTLVLSEVGPWLVRNGETVTTSQTVVVTPATKFIAVKRVDDAPSGYAGDFAEVKLEAWGLGAGDFVTVEGRRERGRFVADRIVRPEPSER